MAISRSGRIAGSVSGGCLEGEVYEQAQRVLERGRAQLFHYGVSDDLAWTVGLSCGGEVESRSPDSVASRPAAARFLHWASRLWCYPWCGY